MCDNTTKKATEASVKNFILHDANEKRGSRNILLFGKVEENIFNMDVQHPMSIFQAFAISLTAIYARHDMYS